jgi:hypothetical protein
MTRPPDCSGGLASGGSRRDSHHRHVAGCPAGKPVSGGLQLVDARYRDVTILFMGVIWIWRDARGPGTAT